jgi:ABC-type transport system substrate-binding protein
VIAREPESTIGEFAQNMWTNVGIRTRLEGLERLAWIDALKAGNFQAAFWQFLGVVVDPDFLQRNIACGAAANWTQFCDKDVDQHMAAGAQTLDEGQRHQSYLQAHRRLQEQAYVGSGYTVPKNFGLRKNVRGVGFQLHWLDMNRIWLE